MKTGAVTNLIDKHLNIQEYIHVFLSLSLNKNGKYREAQ